MKILLEIETHDKLLKSDIFPTKQTVSGDRTITIPGNATIKAKEPTVRRAFGIAESLELVLSFSSGVAASVVANWIIKKIEGRATGLKIDRVEVKLNKGDIEKVLIEKITGGK